MVLASRKSHQRIESSHWFPGSSWAHNNRAPRSIGILQGSRRITACGSRPDIAGVLLRIRRQGEFLAGISKKTVKSRTHPANHPRRSASHQTFDLNHFNPSRDGSLRTFSWPFPAACFSGPSCWQEAPSLPGRVGEKHGVSVSHAWLDPREFGDTINGPLEMNPTRMLSIQQDLLPSRICISL